MTDAELVAAFEACTLDKHAFRHADHVRVAWVYLSQTRFVDAAQRFTTALRRFASHHGVPDLYHETITLAYLALIGERIARMPSTADWEAFREANRDLFDAPSILDRYYAPQTLRSQLARRVFVLPDRALATLDG